jgi:hypothetical protein
MMMRNGIYRGTVMKKKRSVSVLLILFVGVGMWAVAGVAEGARDPLDQYNVVWETASKDSSGSMPIGNGDIGLNVWVEEGGDLLFYISKTDLWSENARLMKLGKVRVKVQPNQFRKGMAFKQTLKLRQGEIEITGGAAEQKVTLRVWVDANQQVIRVEAESKEAFGFEAELEVWRTKERELKGGEANSARGLTRGNYKIIAYPDTILPAKDGRVVWYHRNEKSCYPVTLKNQHLGELLTKYPDPLMGRTFGGCMKGDGLKAVGNQVLKSVEPGKRFVVSIYSLTAQTKTSGEWLKLLENQVKSIDGMELETARAGHRKWWDEFWGRSWIRVSGESLSQKITTNTLPLRIGACSEGQNRFKGYMSRARVFGRAISEEEIAARAKYPIATPSIGLVGDWSFEGSIDGLFINKVDSELGARIVGDLSIAEHEGRKCLRFGGDGYLEVPHSAKLNLTEACTLEAWIAPEIHDGGGGRIIDKSKSGTSNAYLLDTYPGNSLRMIVEAGTLGYDAKFKPGEWVHVAATYEGRGGQSKLYINGKVVASSGAKEDASIVSRGYVLQRWINACGGRGAYPIKFNGSIFTVDAQIGNEHYDGDWRRWGGMFWWQNTRLPYWSMIAAGDFDLMGPLFGMYKDVLGLCTDKTRIYYKHGGAFFPETMYFWGTNGNCDYGWGHKGPETINQYIRREWQGGIEIVSMMLDYYEITGDEEFVRETLLPIAEATVTFYDEHWERDEKGKIRLEPSQSLETWWKCVNPMPEVAGLRFVIPRLLELGTDLTTRAQRRAWKKTLGDLPAIPIKEEDGKGYLLPAEKYSNKRNQENPELYAIFPYRVFGVGKSGIGVAVEAYNRRVHKGTGGWYQTAIQAAYLGLAEDAARFVTKNFSTKDSGSRFPAFWGPNYDWIPDQDHGCVTMTALQRMLIQTEGRKIRLLPAWPKGWDVEFKLHAPMKTTVEGVYRDGKLERLKVTPRSRAKDVLDLSVMADIIWGARIN